MYEIEVRAGMAALDEHVPGWRDDVNPRLIMILSPWRCVLGQVYGSYFSDEANRFIKKINYAVVAHGFQVPEMSDRFAGLTLSETWRRELTATAA